MERIRKKGKKVANKVIIEYDKKGINNQEEIKS